MPKPLNRTCTAGDRWKAAEAALRKAEALMVKKVEQQRKKIKLNKIAKELKKRSVND